MQKEKRRKKWNFGHRLPGKISAGLHDHPLFTISAARAQAVSPLPKYHRTMTVPEIMCRFLQLAPAAPAGAHTAQISPEDWVVFAMAALLW